MEDQTDDGYVSKRLHKMESIYERYHSATDDEFASKSSVQANSSDANPGLQSIDAMKRKAVRQPCLHPRGENVADSDTVSVSSVCAIDGQDVSCIIVIKDIEPSTLSGAKVSEPHIVFLQSFRTVEEAVHYAKHVVQKQYPKFASDVVSTRQWLFPEDVKLSETPKIYANKDLNSIMQRRIINDREVRNMEEILSPEQLEQNTILI